MQINKNMLDSNSLHSIYGLWHKPFWQTTIFYVIVFFVFVLVMSIFIFILLKKYRGKKTKMMPGQRALVDLDKLKVLMLEKKISNQGFYLSLTEIIKNYLFSRFGYDLFGCTDQEVVKFLVNKKFDLFLLENIKDMFKSMQLIKFAAESAAIELMENDLSRSVELINKTVPKLKK